ncbi:hypothetical protein DDD_2949 [Nonlabens dokdonensis DSW-6]|uniref:Uncharacterized protein n=2 Tax=Nonlabens dokdonensis TaxID=328515 RepID=L7WDQ8_NONDD|nr:hypothetical protein DDD_2949 [Nonlabens dokdonensis DSW-6]
MCDDLIEEHLSIGMERARIVELLGEPSSDCIQSDCDMIYELGPCRRGINYGSLYLSFKNNRLIEIFKHCG